MAHIYIYGSQKAGLLKAVQRNSGRWLFIESAESKKKLSPSKSYITSRKYWDGNNIINIKTPEPPLSPSERSFDAKIVLEDGVWKLKVKFLGTQKAQKKAVVKHVVQEYDYFTTGGVLKFLQDGLDPNWDWDKSRPSTGRYRRKK